MTSTVLLKLPPEIVDELAIPYEGLRGAHDIVIAIEGLDVAASLVTLAALRPRASALVDAVRTWRRHKGADPIVITVTGPDIDLRIQLPPNVQSAELLAQLQPLLARAES